MHSFLNEATIQGKIIRKKISLFLGPTIGQSRQKSGLFRYITPAHKMHSLLNGAKIQGFHRKTSMITPGQPLIALGFRKKWTFFSLSNFE